jgi:hypothetical protein
MLFNLFIEKYIFFMIFNHDINIFMQKFIEISNYLVFLNLNNNISN